MTSLAKQLERLAVPFTQSLLVQDKKRASLLFDPKEAANLDREAIFSLGVSGLEELQTIDQIFDEFESSLFNQTSQNWERSLQTEEVNAKLDKTIHKFLIRVSPYLLLKCSHKALEWLIYRYRIHEFNVDSFMMCIIPYHETKIFVRAIQLFNLKDPTNKWHWLGDSSKSGSPLARGTLINHCRKDIGFLAFICEIVHKFIKVHGDSSSQLRAVVGFFAGAALGAVQLKESVTERTLGVLVPQLVRGLRGKCPDLKAACYMLLAQVSVQTTLTESLLKSLLPVLTKRIPGNLTLEALSCLAAVFQTQDIDSLPKKSFKHLCRTPGIIQLLTTLSKKYDISALLQAWFSRLVPLAMSHGDAGSYSGSEGSDDFGQGVPMYSSLLAGGLAELDVSREIVVGVTRQILLGFIEKRGTINEADIDAFDSWREQAKSYQSILERRFGGVFESLVEETLLKYQEDKDQLEILREIMGLSSQPMKFEIVPDSSTNLFLGLNHAEGSVRLLAVQHLVTCISKSDDIDRSFVEEMLLLRLADDNAKVVTSVLQLEYKLTEVIDGKKLSDSLYTILQTRRGSHGWNPVLCAALALLGSEALTDANPDWFLGVFPYLPLMDAKQESVLAVETILRSDRAGKQALLKDALKGLLKQLTDIKSTEKSKVHGVSGNFIASLGETISEGLAKSSQANNKLIEAMMERDYDVYGKAFVILVVSQLVDKLSSTKTATGHKRCVTVALQLLGFIKPHLLGCKELTPSPADAKLADQFAAWMRSSVNKEQIPLFIISHSVEILSKTLKFVTPKGPWIDGVNPEVSLAIGLLDLLMRASCGGSSLPKTWRQHVTKIIDTHLPSESLYHILSYIWLADTHPVTTETRVSPILQVGAFYLVNTRWEQGSEEHGVHSLLLTSDETVLPSLLCCLMSEHEPVRRGAILCLSNLRSKIKKGDTCHSLLLKKIINHQEEILADPNHIVQTIYKVYSKSDSADSPGKSPAKQETRESSLQQLLVWSTADDTPAQVKLRLVKMLQLVPHQLVLDSLLNLGEKLLAGITNSETADTHLDILAILLGRLDETLAPSLTIDSKAYKFLVKCLQLGDSVKPGVSPQTIALSVIKKGMFQTLPSVQVQQDLLSTLLTAAGSVKGSDIHSKFKSTIKQLKLSGSQVELELKGKEEESTTVRGKKKARTQAVTPLDYERLSLLMEVIQSRKKFKERDYMASVIFAFLKRLQPENGEEVEYCRQLALSCLHSICSKWSEETKPAEDKLNVEVLVHCIRSSPSQQTQQQALMVMASIAPVFPDYILHNMMSVFTFMGSSLLQQDDSYSFQIISKTIDTIIPAIIKAQTDKGVAANKMEQTMTEILTVFVDSRHHIPRHRSQVVFRQLLETVGTSQYLWVVLALWLDSMVRNKDVPVMDEGLGAEVPHEDLSRVDKEIDGVVMMCSQFSVRDQLKASIQLTSMLQKLLDHLEKQGAPAGGRNRGKKAVVNVPVVKVGSLTAQQCRLVQYHGTRLLTSLMSRQEFITQILDQSTETSVSDDLYDLFRNLVQECLCYLTQVARATGTEGATPSGKFWRALLSKIYELLDKVNYLLPSGVFIEVSSSLMQHELLSVRRKALELFNNKLQQIDIDTLPDDQVYSLLSVVDKLVTIAAAEQATGSDSDVTTSRQMALFSLKVLCKLLGAKHPTEFTKMFEVSLAVVTTPEQAPPVLGSGLLCIAELVSSLKAHAIPYLSKFMSPVLAILNDTQLLKSHELLLTCGLTVLQRTLISLPHFLSPYLNDILLVVCTVSQFVEPDEASQKKSQSALRLNSVKHQLATTIPPRVLIPALTQTRNKLESSSSAGMPCLMGVVQAHIEAMSKEDLLAHHTAILTLLTAAMDVRNNSRHMPESDIEKREGEVMQATLSMVVRLSENTFRPMFYRLYDWSCREETDEHKNRQISFYRLCDSLSARLRSLFNLFVSHMLKHAAQLLDTNNTSKGDVNYFTGEDGDNKSCILLRHILTCLHKCFMHDTEGFATKEIFNLVLNPIVDQLENSLGTESDYQARITDCVVPCVGQLAVAVKDDSCWKTLNYQVLLKTRHASPKVRYAAVNAVHELATKLGDEYMSLLPETIPFLAELMEDESEEVEQRCQQVTAALEELLGESLQKYF